MDEEKLAPYFKVCLLTILIDLVLLMTGGISANGGALVMLVAILATGIGGFLEALEYSYNRPKHLKGGVG